MKDAQHPVEAHAEGPVWVITLSRPKARNSVNLELARRLAAAADEFESRTELRIAVLTGAAGCFCSGMDLKAFAAGERPWLPEGGFAGFVERRLSKPVIAAVEGYAVAGGLEIALACDLIVASRAARFGLPEVRRGIVAAAGGLMRLPMRIPHALAAELCLTGRTLDAEEAWRAGLLSRLVDPGQALAEACALAREIAAQAPLAVAASLHVLRASRCWPEDEMFGLQQPLIDAVFASEDAMEGARAFAEKRAPVWKGR